MGLSPIEVIYTSDIVLISSKKFLDIEANIERGFSLKCVSDMIRLYSQMHLIEKYSQQSSIIWPVLSIFLVFVYKLSGCRFEFCCSNLNFKYCVFLEQGVL